MLRKVSQRQTNGTWDPNAQLWEGKVYEIRLSMRSVRVARAPLFLAENSEHRASDLRLCVSHAHRSWHHWCMCSLWVEISFRWLIALLLVMLQFTNWWKCFSRGTFLHHSSRRREKRFCGRFIYTIDPISAISPPRGTEKISDSANKSRLEKR